MTKEEIFILNRALDGIQIYGMPDFATMHISELLIDSYKEGMIRRGYLKDKGSLSEEGAKIVMRMKNYKEASTYLSLNNLTIGRNESGKAVSLLYNPVYDEYKFSNLNLPKDSEEVLKAYNLFDNVKERENEEVGRFSPQELKNKYGESVKKNLVIKKKSKSERKSFTVFVKDGEAYLYNDRTGNLSIVGRKQIEEIIKEGLH